MPACACPCFDMLMKAMKNGVFGGVVAGTYHNF